MEPSYAAICGITEDELQGQLLFAVDEIAADQHVDREELLRRLKDYYDGYHFTFDSSDIYNPFSLMSAFAACAIESYWFGLGAPTSLIKLINAHGWQIADIASYEADATEFDVPTEQMAAPIAMPYQAG